MRPELIGFRCLGSGIQASTTLPTRRARRDHVSRGTRRWSARRVDYRIRAGSLGDAGGRRAPAVIWCVAGGRVPHRLDLYIGSAAGPSPTMEWGPSIVKEHLPTDTEPRSSILALLGGVARLRGRPSTPHYRRLERTLGPGESLYDGKRARGLLQACNGSSSPAGQPSCPSGLRPSPAPAPAAPATPGARRCTSAGPAPRCTAGGAPSASPPPPPSSSGRHSAGRGPRTRPETSRPW